MAGLYQIKVIGTGNTEELILLHQKKQHMTDGGHRYIAFLSEYGLKYCSISHIYTVPDFFFFSKMPHLNADRLVGIVNVFAM